MSTRVADARPLIALNSGDGRRVEKHHNGEMEPPSRLFNEHAQNGARRGPVPDTLGGARRTLCA